MSPTRVCPACGATDQGETLVVREMMFGLDESFSYDVCPACRSLALRDVPADMAPYYPHDYYSIDVDPESELGRPGVREFARSVSRSILFGRGSLAAVASRLVGRRQFHSFVIAMRSVAFAGLPPGRRSAVLDVGCGSGIIVYALAQAGVATSVGVDPFAPEDRAFDNGARLLRRDLAEVEGPFDLVMFHHSLEHVPDPGASLEQAARLLTPGGRILVRMPTVSCDAFDEYGVDWVQLDAPRHITLFSRAGVEALATRHGLRVTEVRDDSTSFQFWGSEQVRRRIPLMAPTSHLISERHSMFSGDQLASWGARAEALNEVGRGDQAAWVLTKA